MRKIVSSVSMNIKQMRLHNARLLLELIYKYKTLSKSELAHRSQLTLPAVTQILNFLLDKDVISTTPRTQAVRGNSDVLYTISEQRPDTLCLSVSPHTLSYVIVDHRITPRQPLHTLPISPLSPQHLIDKIVEVYHQAKKPNKNKKMVIAMALHGQVDTETGTSMNMPQAPWKEPIEFKYLLENQLQTEVLLDNDCVMLALAEKWQGEHGQQDFCVLNIDYGIGSSFLINNDIYRGKLFGSGQIGHTILYPDGKRCGCGRYGCLETIASTQAMLSEIRTHMKAELHRFPDKDIDTLTFNDCIQLYRDQEPCVANVVDSAARTLGLSLYNFILTLNINQIILYGQATQLGEEWKNRIIQQLMYNPFEQSNSLKQYKTLIQLGTLSQEQLMTGIGYLFVEREIQQRLCDT